MADEPDEKPSIPANDCLFGCALLLILAVAVIGGVFYFGSLFDFKG